MLTAEQCNSRVDLGRKRGLSTRISAANVCPSCGKGLMVIAETPADADPPNRAVVATSSRPDSIRPDPP